MASVSLTQLVGQLAEGQLTATELMERTLERIDSTHEALNAFTFRASAQEVLEQARSADEKLSAGTGRALEGVPLAVKDLEDVGGMPTSKGSRLFEGQVADRDSTQVERLRAAGAIVVGKTNTPEFGFTAISKNLAFGTSRSPWILERTPGGSSG